MEMQRAEQSHELSPPLRARAGEGAAPLTATQRGFWRYAVRHNGQTVGNVSSATRILGQLDTEVLQESLQALVQRHEALRTRIEVIDGAPRQAVATRASVPIECEDLSHLPQEGMQAELKLRAQAFAEAGCDMALGPMFRAALLRSSERDHVLVLAADHVVSDAACAAILNRELWTLYTQGTSGLPFSLPALRVQFADYASWQEATYDGWRTEHEHYWRERLAGAPQIELPCDRDSQEPMCRTNASMHVPFGKKLSDALRAFARREKVPLLLVVLTAYACTMAKWCERRDLLIAFVTHGRHLDPELRSMVGCLASSLLLRIELREESFIRVLRGIRHEFEAAFRHYDFDRVAELMPQHTTDLGFNWLSTTLLRSSSAAPMEAQRLRLQPFPLRFSWLAKLVSFFADTPASITAGVTYRPDLLLPQTMDRFGRDLRLCAQAIVANPSARAMQTVLESGPLLERPGHA